MSLTRIPLLTECNSWLGVPHVNHGDSRRGIDCVHFVTTVYRNVYGIEAIVPDYSSFLGLHKESDAMIQALEQNGLKRTEEAVDGALVVFNQITTSAHIGIICDGYIYHSAYGYGVCKHKYSLLRKKVSSLWVPKTPLL